MTGVGVFVANTSEAGFVSDYNLFQTGSGGRIGTWLGLSQTTLSQWQTATAQDAQSQSGNPQFVNRLAGRRPPAISRQPSPASPMISTS